MVMVGGHPRYGVNALVESVAPGATWTPISVAGSAKEVVLPSDPKLGSWQELTSSLDAAMQPVGTHLGPIVCEWDPNGDAQSQDFPKSAVRHYPTFKIASNSWKIVA